ncbi:MAG TPA: hypothetical protein VGD80_39170 [Kofleriaceae bacterium]
MRPPVRKLVLTAHVTFSVGWFGAIAAFLALAIGGLVSDDAEMVRADYLAMASIGWFVIVPLGAGSLLVGVVQSLGTEWGLFRHYWVLVKLVLTVAALTLLLVHMRLVSHVSSSAGATGLSAGDLRGLRIQLVGDATGALVVLLVNTVLSIYKPRGMTRRGRRAQRERSA